MFDSKEARWTHFNSKIPTDGAPDHHYEFVGLVMDYVDKLNNIKYMEDRRAIDPSVQFIQSELNTTQENFLQTPQQGAFTNDCGVFVLMFMDMIMDGKGKDEIADKRLFTDVMDSGYYAKLIKKFIELGRRDKCFSTSTYSSRRRHIKRC